MKIMWVWGGRWRGFPSVRVQESRARKANKIMWAPGGRWRSGLATS